MNRKRLALTLALTLLAGCAAFSGLGEAPLHVVAADFPCYDFARAVIGGADNITLLIKPGQDVHTFDPAPEDIVTVMEADLFLYIGGESDVWADSILASLGSDAPAVARMFDVVELLEEETVEGMEGHEAHDHDHEPAAYDEHIWTSPKNAVRMVRFIEEKLTALDSKNADVYAKNANAYVAEIMELDAAFRAVVENAPRRELVFGDRFPFLYFAREYGLSYVAAFPGCSSETEPSAQTVTFLIDRILREDVPAIYQIELSTGNIARTLSAETGAEILTLHSIQNLSMADFEAGENYISLMRRNLDALERGLN